MRQSELLATLNRLMPLIKESRDPSGELIKCARERRLSVEQLQRLGQLFNATATLSNIKEASTPADRGQTLQLLDVQGMIDEYAKGAFKTRPVTAKAASTAPKAQGYYSLSALTSEKAAVKAASSGRSKETLQSFDRYESNVAADIAMSELREDREMEIELVAMHRDGQRKKAAALIFLKKACLASPVAFHEILQDTEAMQWMSKAALASFREAADEMVSENKLKPAEVPAETRRVAWDRHGFEKYAKAWDVGHATVSVLDELTKEAFGPAGVLPPPSTPTQNTPQGPSGSGQQGNSRPGGKLPQPLTDSSYGSDQMLLAALTTTGGRPNTVRSTTLENAPEMASKTLDEASKAVHSIGELIPDPKSLLLKFIESKPDAGVKAMDKVRDSVENELETSTMLQRLISTDVVLSKMQPGHVMDAYNAIKDVNPGISNNPAAMRLLLREAASYQGAPLHTLTNLGALRKNMADSSAREAESSAAKYRTSVPSSGQK